MDLQASVCFIGEIKVKIVCFKSEFLLYSLADSLVIALDVYVSIAMIYGDFCISRLISHFMGFSIWQNFLTRLQRQSQSSNSTVLRLKTAPPGESENNRIFNSRSIPA
ncbi:hypothetical protein ISN45_Aa02g013890 [Arabidopsis thaliana x Arabidopsis arenosa]|uniref:Transmembrane protein n=1 Tax=Arabidopsis thaliana x Arabidopsis arenosa TaxID=1240361 RepID=A0A8T2BII1_9BRAS|nr:hypothetical protein ISN45_Aa02g013890 [Arabidopsis thaliana x Arabidopsis arenosa]